MLLAAAIVLLIVPLSHYRLLQEVEAFSLWRAGLGPLIEKTDFGLLRYVHFLALAYLACVAVGPRGARLVPPEGDGSVARVWRAGLAVVLKVGQQSLAVFIASMFLARLLGVALDVMGRNNLSMMVVNLGGMAVLVAVAYGAGWFKSAPWRKPLKQET
jgi:hypothetical protein